MRYTCVKCGGYEYLPSIKDIVKVNKLCRSCISNKLNNKHPNAIEKVLMNGISRGMLVSGYRCMECNSLSHRDSTKCRRCGSLNIVIDSDKFHVYKKE